MHSFVSALELLVFVGHGVGVMIGFILTFVHIGIIAVAWGSLITNKKRFGVSSDYVIFPMLFTIASVLLGVLGVVSLFGGMDEQGIWVFYSAIPTGMLILYIMLSYLVLLIREKNG